MNGPALSRAAEYERRSLRFLLFFAITAIVIQFGQSFDSHESTDNTHKSIEDSHEMKDPFSQSHESLELISTESKSSEDQDRFSEPQHTIKQDVDTKQSDVPVDGVAPDRESSHFVPLEAGVFDGHTPHLNLESSETPGVAYGGNGSHGPEDYHLGAPDRESSHFVPLEAGVFDGHTPHLNVESSETPGVAYGGNGSHGPEDYHLGGQVHGDDSNKTEGQQVEASHPPAIDIEDAGVTYGGNGSHRPEDYHVGDPAIGGLTHTTSNAEERHSSDPQVDVSEVPNESYGGNESHGEEYHLNASSHGGAPTVFMEVEEVFQEHTRVLNNETAGANYEGNEAGGAENYHLQEDVPVPTTDNNVVAALTADTTETQHVPYDDDGNHHGAYHLGTTFVEDNSVPFIPAASPSRLVTPKEMDPEILI